jgi:hypothetical protein
VLVLIKIPNLEFGVARKALGLNGSVWFGLVWFGLVGLG